MQSQPRFLRIQSWSWTSDWRSSSSETSIDAAVRQRQPARPGHGSALRTRWTWIAAPLVSSLSQRHVQRTRGAWEWIYPVSIQARDQHTASRDRCSPRRFDAYELTVRRVGQQIEESVRSGAHVAHASDLSLSMRSSFTTLSPSSSSRTSIRSLSAPTNRLPCHFGNLVALVEGHPRGRDRRHPLPHGLRHPRLRVPSPILVPMT